MIANPTDLVKVRLQSEGKLPPGVPRRYSGAVSAYSTIVKQVTITKSMSLYLLPAKSISNLVPHGYTVVENIGRS